MMEMLTGGIELLFGCRHRASSRVFTIRNRTYYVCMTCGKEFNYSWTRMQETGDDDRCLRSMSSEDKSLLKGNVRADLSL